MHILLTRPLEDCSDLIIKFKELGHTVSHLPVIKIKKKEYGEPNYNEFSSLKFDQATIVPPDPLIKASADILVAASIFK